MSSTTRNSKFELLRIVAMLLIVFYHLVTYYLYQIPNPANHEFFTALFPRQSRQSPDGQPTVMYRITEG